MLIETGNVGNARDAQRFAHRHQPRQRLVGRRTKALISLQPSPLGRGSCRGSGFTIKRRAGLQRGFRVSTRSR